MIIRQAEIKDAWGIASVHVRSWQKIYKGRIPQQHLDSLSIPDRASKWEEIISDPLTNLLVAEIDDEIVGFCGGGKSREKDRAEFEGELYSIYLDPDYFRKGVGSALLTAMENLLKDKGFKELTLWVLDTNTEARNFYEAKGWYLDGKEKIDESRGFPLSEVRYKKSLK